MQLSTIQKHQNILNSQGLSKLGKTQLTRKEKVGIVFIHIFAALTLIGMIPAFLLIHRHYKKVGLQTIQKDNILQLNTLFNRTFTKKEVDLLYARKLIVTHQYLSQKNLEEIKKIFGTPSSEDLSKKQNLNGDKETQSANATNLDPADSDLESASESDDLDTEEQLSSSSSHTDQKTDTNLQDSPPHRPSPRPLTPPSSPKQPEKSVSIQIPTKSAANPLTPVQEFTNKLNAVLMNVDRDSKNTDHAKNCSTIVEKALEYKQKNRWTFEQTLIRFTLAFGECLTRTKTSNSNQAAKDLKEALDPPFVTWFQSDAEKTKNAQTLQWIMAPLPKTSRK